MMKRDYTIHFIDNFKDDPDAMSSSGDHFLETYLSLAEDITDLVVMNIEASNDGAYSQEALMRLKANKTLEATQTLIVTSFLVCVYDGTRLIACGFLKRQDGRCFAKSLHVHPNYRGQGLANFIVSEREAYLKSIGVTEVFIESMKFENTIQFHKRHGYFVETPYKPLKNTILMKKTLR